MSDIRELRASLWWCGDYECDCIQPIIEECAGGRPVKRVWEGTLVSSPDGPETDRAWDELRRACEERGLACPRRPGAGTPRKEEA